MLSNLKSSLAPKNILLETGKLTLGRMSFGMLYKFHAADRFNEIVQEIVKFRIPKLLQKRALKADIPDYLWFTHKDEFFMAGCILRECNRDTNSKLCVTDLLSKLNGDSKIRKRLPRFYIGYSNLVDKVPDLPKKWRSFENLTVSENSERTHEIVQAEVMLKDLGMALRNESDCMFYQLSSLIVAGQWVHGTEAKWHENRCREKCCLKLQFTLRSLIGQTMRTHSDEDCVRLAPLYAQRDSFSIQVWSRNFYDCIKSRLNLPLASHHTIDAVYGTNSVAMPHFLDSLLTDDLLISLVRCPSELRDIVRLLLATPSKTQSDEMGVAACSLIMAVTQAAMVMCPNAEELEQKLGSLVTVFVQIKRKLPNHRLYFFDFVHNKLRISAVENMYGCACCSSYRPDVDYVFWRRAQEFLVAETTKLNLQKFEDNLSSEKSLLVDVVSQLVSDSVVPKSKKFSDKDSYFVAGRQLKEYDIGMDLIILLPAILEKFEISQMTEKVSSLLIGYLVNLDGWPDFSTNWKLLEKIHNSTTALKSEEMEKVISMLQRFMHLAKSKNAFLLSWMNDVLLALFERKESHYAQDSSKVPNIEDLLQSAMEEYYDVHASLFVPKCRPINTPSPSNSAQIVAQGARFPYSIKMTHVWNKDSNEWNVKYIPRFI